MKEFDLVKVVNPMQIFTTYYEFFDNPEIEDFFDEYKETDHKQLHEDDIVRILYIGKHCDTTLYPKSVMVVERPSRAGIYLIYEEGLMPLQKED